MDIMLAMLAENAIKKLDNKEWDRFPRSLERNIESSGQTHDVALYRYFIKNAVQYPKVWMDNNYGARVLAEVIVKDEEMILDNIKIINKSNALLEKDVYKEVEKTIKRANDSTLAFLSPLENNIPSSVITRFEVLVTWKLVE